MCCPMCLHQQPANKGSRKRRPARSLREGDALQPTATQRKKSTEDENREKRVQSAIRRTVLSMN